MERRRAYFTPPLSPVRLCRNRGNGGTCRAELVSISNQTYLKFPQISPPPSTGEGEGGGGWNSFVLDLVPPPLHPLPRRGGESFYWSYSRMLEINSQTLCLRI